MCRVVLIMRSELFRSIWTILLCYMRTHLDPLLMHHWILPSLRIHSKLSTLCYNQSVFQLFETRVTLVRPNILHCLMHQFEWRACYFREILHKFSIILYQPKNTLHFSHQLWNRLTLHYLQPLGSNKYLLTWLYALGRIYFVSRIHTCSTFLGLSLPRICNFVHKSSCTLRYFISSFGT